MSKRRHPRENSRATNERVELPKPIPLKPRRGWFIGLLIVFAVWVGFLAVLYVQTIYWPHRSR